MAKLLSYEKVEYGPNCYALRKTAFQYIDQWAEMYPQNEAYVFRRGDIKEAVTYNQLQTATERYASWFLSQFAIQKGDRIAFACDNCLLSTLCDLSLGRLGAVSVRLNSFVSSKDELHRILLVNECTMILCQSETLPLVKFVHDVMDELPKMKNLLVFESGNSNSFQIVPNYEEIQVSDFEIENLHCRQKAISVDDDCMVYSTSGELSEFIVLSHGSRINFLAQNLLNAGIRNSDRFFNNCPVEFLDGSMTMCLPFGATMVVVQPSNTVLKMNNDVKHITEIFKEENTTCGFTSSYLLNDIAKEDSEMFLDLNLKFLLFVGHSVSLEILQRVKDQLKTVSCIIKVYVRAELGEISGTRRGDDLSFTCETVGRIVAGTELKVVDAESKQILARGDIGLVAVRQPHKWRYLSDEDMQKTHDCDGYFYPGELGKLRLDGRLEILTAVSVQGQ